MRVERCQSRPAAGIFGFFVAFGGIGCMVTGLRIYGVSMIAVAVVCALAAAVTAVFAGRKLFLIAPAALVITGLMLWQTGSLNLSAEALLSHITSLYDMGYGWGVIRWSAERLSTDMAQLVLCMLGMLIAVVAAWSFLRFKGVWLTAMLVAVPVIPCMLLTDTVPASQYLFIQLSCLVLLLLLRLVRKQKQDIALLKLLALPVAAAVLLLFVLMPPKSYSSLKQVDVILGHVQELFTDGSKETPQTPVRQEGDWVNLKSVGPKSHRRGLVMEVSSSHSGYLYLKGAAFDTYYGTWWDCRETSQPVPAAPPSSYRTVQITTRAIHDVLYLPYGAYSIGSSANSVSLAEKRGQVENAGPWRSYDIKYRQQPTFNGSWQLPSAAAPDLYTQLPNGTRRAAADYLAQNLPELDTMAGVWDKATAIVNHVSKSARYSLQTAKMPEGHSDFALWFLKESDTGYCIHFASAATVLLRAAGIPTRYVTGYLVNAHADLTVDVTQDNAHAWAECYIDGVGWVPLEATPGNGVTETVGGETTAPTTLAPETTGTEESTQETETTEPTQTQGTSVPPTSAQTQSNPSEETTPSGGVDAPAAQPTVMLYWLKWIAGILCAIAAFIGQWRLRVNLRKQKRSRGKRNAQALARWREVVLHCRVRKETPDEHLHELAQKARFSHHAVTREELKEFDDWLVASRESISHMGFMGKLLATVIFALY